MQTCVKAIGSPAKLVKQLSVMYPCGNGQLSEAGGVASGTVMLGQFTLSYGQFSFTNFAGEPGDRGEVSGAALIVGRQGAPAWPHRADAVVPRGHFCGTTQAVSVGPTMVLGPKPWSHVGPSF